MFGRIGKRGRSIASPTGMKEVTGRNEAEDSRLPPGITSITSLRTTRIPLRVTLAAVDDLSLRTVDEVNLKKRKKRKEKKRKERKGKEIVRICAFSFVINVIVVE